MGSQEDMQHRQPWHPNMQGHALWAVFCMPGRMRTAGLQNIHTTRSCQPGYGARSEHAHRHQVQRSGRGCRCPPPQSSAPAPPRPRSPGRQCPGPEVPVQVLGRLLGRRLLLRALQDACQRSAPHTPRQTSIHEKDTPSQPAIWPSSCAQLTMSTRMKCGPAGVARHCL